MRNRTTIVRGWTLVELLAVVSLMTVLMLGAVFTVRAPLAAGRVQGAIDAVLLVDRLTRSETRRLDRSEIIVFESDRTHGMTVHRESEANRMQRMPQHIDGLVEVRTSNSHRDSSKVSIPINAAGRSQTYALKFQPSTGQETWVLIVGGSGQPVLGLTSKQVHEIFNELDTKP